MDKNTSDVLMWGAVAVGAYFIYQTVTSVGKGAATVAAGVETGVGDAVCSIWPFSQRADCIAWNAARDAQLNVGTSGLMGYRRRRKIRYG